MQAVCYSPAELFRIPSSPGGRVHQLTSVVEQILYSSSQNGFAVLKMRPSASLSGKDLFSATGTVGDVREGEQLVLSGTWENNPKFGMQLKVSEVLLPDYSGDGVYDFLVGKFVKGIGPRLGEEIWATFGAKTSLIFEEEPERLLEVKGIGNSKLTEIVNAWKEIASKRIALIEFSRLGLNTGIVQKIFAKWANPDYALELIKSDPYRLAWDISGVGFLTADLAAKRLGIGSESKSRLAAGLGYVLHMAATKEGHCFLEKESLFARSLDFLQINNAEPLLEQALNDLECDGHIERVQPGGDREFIYLAHVAHAEQKLAYRLKALTKQKFPVLKNFEQIISQYERKEKIKLHAAQQEAIRTALESQVAVITGGPGTGKTTIIKAIINILHSEVRRINIALCAPTGRAAKRMSTSSGHEASTIHRLLEFAPGEGFVYNSNNPLPNDVVICDESSMLDVFLARSLVSAIRASARIIFVGDVNQLPSVGAGAVLRDIIASGTVPTCYLTQIYRQSDGSFIAHNATAILNGDAKGLNLSNQTEDFFWMGINNQKKSPEERQAAIKTMILKCVHRLLELGYTAHDVQVLCPMYKGNIGVNALNVMLQQVFNPKGRVVYVSKERQFCLGDKVMQTKNNYDKEVFNGDQGTVVDHANDTYVVDFEGKEVCYEKEEMIELTLCYAITIHKAQGSEAKAVIQAISTAYYTMLQRSILYTGITRARERCILIGEFAALKMAIANNCVAQRNTYLAERIRIAA